MPWCSRCPLSPLLRGSLGHRRTKEATKTLKQQESQKGSRWLVAQLTLAIDLSCKPPPREHMHGVCLSENTQTDFLCGNGETSSRKHEVASFL